MVFFILEVKVVDIKKKYLVEGDIKLHNFRGTEYIKEFIDTFKGSTVLVYFDPDVDGLISGLFVCRLLQSKGIDFVWYINKNREHGMLLPLGKLKNMNIICVDFVISKAEISCLVDNGCNVLSLDHHDIGSSFIDYSNKGKRGIIINNQYSFEEDTGRYLSGAGVVFESLVSIYPEFNTRENKALVGLTLLSDIRDIENINARLYLQTLYTHPYKGYIRYLIDATLGVFDYSFGLPRLDRSYVDYKLSPCINSCLRFNKEDMIVDFILGRGGLDTSYQAKQKKLVGEIVEKAKVIEYSNLKVVIIDESKFKNCEYQGILTNFVGLVASKYLDGNKSVIGYVIRNREVLRASFRGNINGLNYLSSIEKYANCVGHPSAFGIKDLVPSNDLFKNINKVCLELESGYNYSFDVLETVNLSMSANSKAYKLGVDNIFCLSHNRSYIKYNGSNIVKKRGSNSYTEYEVDGISVLCFDNTLSVNDDYILPLIERGVLTFYLSKKRI